MRVPFVADLKRNALDDGPGVRTTVFFKGCPLACVWCHNPETIRATPEIIFREEHCIACRECVSTCPHGATGPSGGGAIDRDRCIRCGACVDTCPGGARERVGRQYEVDELLALLLRDELLFTNSGGGVTLSGGEPTLCTKYVGALARKLHERGIHVLVESCGWFDASRFDDLLRPWIDTIYVDLKLLDPVAHERFCGRSNAPILANLERLLSRSQPEVLVRVPLVPTITATRENLTAIAAWLRARGAARVWLLPYNPLWQPKARGVGADVRFTYRGFLTEADRQIARETFADFSILGLD
ncbi:MAG: glycyl-radical enzyme activating protein [Polyangiales bacterium]